MNANDRNRVLAITAGSFLAFLIFGGIDVLKGATLSAMLEDLRYNYSRGGLVVMAAYCGFVVAVLLTGVIADRGGKKRIIVVASLAYLAGMCGYSLASALPLLAGAFFLIGFGCGSIELGASYIIVDVQKRNPGLYLSILAAFYGAGSMLAPVYASRMFATGHTWREIYQYALVAPAILLIFFAILRYPRIVGGAEARMDFPLLAKTAFTGAMCWIYFLNFAYVAAEVCIATWLVEYLKVMRGVPIETGSTWLAVFFGGITAGRFLGGFFIDRVGYIRSMAIATVLSIACILLGVYGPAGLDFLLPATGLFLSIILPAATALVSTMGFKNMGSILGLFFCFVGLGGMAGPWIAGVVNDWLGLRMGMAVAAVFCLAILVSLVFIHRALKRETGR